MSAPDAAPDAAPDGFDVSAEPSAEECVDYLERIVSFIDNELDDADCAAVRVHLDTCNPCLVKYDLQRTIKSVVARSCAEAAPSELRERVLVSLRQVRVSIAETRTDRA